MTQDVSERIIQGLPYQNITGFLLILAGTITDLQHINIS